MRHLRALQLILTVDLQGLPELGLDTHGLVLHALLDLMSPYGFLPDFGPHSRTYLLSSKPHLLTQIRHNPKRPLLIPRIALILLLKLLGAISQHSKQ